MTSYRVTLRALLLTVAVAASLAACQRNEQKAPEASKAAAAVAADGPLKYESATPYAKVSLTLPDAIKTQPELYAAL